MTLREKPGSAEARQLRKAGRLPAVLYGLGRSTISLSVEGGQFRKLFEAGQRVFDLKHGNKEQLCLLKDVQHDPIGDHIIHVDFTRIDEESIVAVTVALHYVGIPEQVSGAFSEFPNQDIKVRCMPRNIPSHVDVTLTGLEVGSHIEAGQIELPEGVELESAVHDVVVTYHFRHAGMDGEEADDAGAESVEPEVLTEKKPEPEE
jgi:large subunit ribosomal protein L25